MDRVIFGKFMFPFKVQHTLILSAFCLENSASVPLPYGSTDHKVDLFMDFRIGLEPFRVLVRPGPPKYGF